MKLEQLQTNAAIRGILPDALVTVVNVQWFGSEALELGSRPGLLSKFAKLCYMSSGRCSARFVFNRTDAYRHPGFL